jgi:hypothetical protein|tara:strand:+ start:1603 stop:2442 length:840 start_codon:yes stop_codon:yes gene_type:complete
MEKTDSPLKKYRRQPKLYVSIPSNGKWYDETIVAENTYTNLAVFSMTASDEILFKTPDALINGIATANNISSCIPAILDPWKIKTLDLDAILIAIRMASYGETMNINTVCNKCSAENTYEVNLQSYLDYFASKTYVDKLSYNNFVLNFAPLNYKQWSEIQKQQTSYSRALNLQVSKIKDDDEKEKFIQTLIDKINYLVAKSVLDQVVSIEVDGEVETNPAEIQEFLENQDVDLYHKIKKLIETNTKEWSLPSENVECTSCNNKSTIKVSLDTSDFFVQG